MADNDNPALKSVVVIGAGISGLSAASRLVRHGGFNVTVLEGSDRIGGRIHSASFGANTVEIGAQWVHGESGNRVFEIANSNGLLHIEDCGVHKKFGATARFVTQNGELLPGGMHDKLVKFMDELHGAFGDNENADADVDKKRISTLSLGDAATEAFWRFNEEERLHENIEICAGILDWIHRFQNSIDGADHWDHTSLIGQGEYKQCDGNPTISWKNPANYSTLFELILNSKDESMICNLAEVDEDSKYSKNNIPRWIELGKEVVKVQYLLNDAPVKVTCKDGSEYTCDYLICTLPLGVMKDCHSTLFTPELPYQKVKAIEHIGFGTVDKIFLEFDHRWWPADCDGFNLLWDNKNKENWTSTAQDLDKIDPHTDLPVWTRSLLGFYGVHSQPNVLVTWITGEPARHMEKLDLDKVGKVLVGVLRKFPGCVFSVPEPIGIKRSEWHKNPFSRGSYSFRQMASEANDVWAHELAEPLFRDENLVVCFAGEATHSHFYSTVHGGFGSGVREADRIIKHAYDKGFSCGSTFS